MTQPTPSPRLAGDVASSPPDTHVLSSDERDFSHKRAHARVELAIPVVVHEINGCLVGNAMPCICTDFSQGGFRVRCRKVLYAGQVLAMILPQKSGDSKVFFGILRNVRYGASGRYDLGVQLTATPDFPAVRAWAAQQCRMPKAA